jgi:tetratricopeptide (TPR) repeat protein
MNYNDRKKYAEKLIQDDKYLEAMLEYSALIKENPQDSKIIERFVFLWQRIQAGNYDFEPETPEQYTMRGIAKFYNNEIENSINDFTKALSLDPNYDYALKLRAFSLKFLGRLDNAMTDLKKAISIQPTGEYYDDLSEIYALIGDKKTALYFHEKAIETTPNDARLWYNYGVELRESGNLKEALNKFNKAIELWPQYDDAIVNRQHVIEILKKQNAL